MIFLWACLPFHLTLNPRNCTKCLLHFIKGDQKLTDWPKMVFTVKFWSFGFLSSLMKGSRHKFRTTILVWPMHNRVLSRFFDQVGHGTTYASSGIFFSLNNVIVRLMNRIMNRADKNWAHFKKMQYSKASSCKVFGSWKKTGISKTGLHEVGRKKKWEDFTWIFVNSCKNFVICCFFTKIGKNPCKIRVSENFWN